MKYLLVLLCIVSCSNETDNLSKKISTLELRVTQVERELTKNKNCKEAERIEKHISKFLKYYKADSYEVDDICQYFLFTTFAGLRLEVSRDELVILLLSRKI